MSANSFGSRFVITTFGESHGPALGVLIDGCPAGIAFDPDQLMRELARRRPGSSAVVSARNEADVAEVLSGVHEGKTLGTPIAILVRNQDARSEDYQDIAKNPRPGHADAAWRAKFGHVDPRGAGRSSGRETVARVMAGAVAAMVLRELAPSLEVRGFASQIGPLALSEKDPRTVEVEALLTSAKTEGRSYGGVAELRITGVPAGLGQPVFHKLKADLASAMLGVGATSAIEIGAGTDAATQEGSEWHRAEGHEKDDGRYGGIQGGISTGAPISISVTFKPTSSVLDVAKKGRHDPCIVPRAIPVLEAMAKLVLLDHLLWARTDRR